MAYGFDKDSLPCRYRIGLVFGDGRRELALVHRLSPREVILHSPHPTPVPAEVQAILFLISAATAQTIPVPIKTRVMSCVFDGATIDYRISLGILAYESQGKDMVQNELRRVSQQQDVNYRVASGGPKAYPLRRQISLALPNDEAIPAWTEQVSKTGLRVSSSHQFERHSRVALELPILLPTETQIQHVRATAQVGDVVLRAMGNFASNLRFLEFSQGSRELLQEELRQRFHDGEPTLSTPGKPNASRRALLEDRQRLFGEDADEPPEAVEALPRLGRARQSKSLFPPAA